MMPICFASRSSGDADSDGIDASIEVSWRIQSIIWSDYIKGGSIEPTYEIMEFEDTTTDGLSITKIDGKFYITSTTIGIDGECPAFVNT